MLIALATALSVAGCGGPATPDPRMVELAVRATVHAMSTPVPVTLEVTRLVEVTRIVQVTRVVEVTPLVPTATPSPTQTVTPTAKPQTQAEPTRSADEVVVQAAAAAEPDTSCPSESAGQYAAVPVVGATAEHPDSLHGDLNLALRGFELISAHSGLVTINGPTDSDPPQLVSIVGRVPAFVNNYRVRGWNWSCATHGCSTGPLDHVEVSMVGVAAAAGEPVRIPSRKAQIYGGGFAAMVLYADDNRITLGYTREDTVAVGYAVHIENFCVDPGLLALYRSTNFAGRGQLPALRNGEAIGTALGSELGVAVRDTGTFMDPRSRKDWWQGH